MVTVKTYISTSSLNGCFYPQKAQSQVIRAYCMDREVPFSLPITEQLGFIDILSSQVLNSDIEHLICFSAYQIDEASLKAIRLLEEALDKGMKLHFALESIEVNSLEQWTVLREKLKLEKSNDQIEMVGYFYKYKGRETDFITKNHLKSSRNYQERATEEKPRLAKIAKQFEKDFWDGARETGYGGYHDDGRWNAVAQKMIDFYKLSDQSRILDIGCGKGYLLKEFKNLLPQSEVWGIDVSKYALEQGASEVRDHLLLGNATYLPFENHSFDLVISNMTLHNLLLPQLKASLREINRVSRMHSWIGVESYTNEEQKWNLMRWQLTCECFFTPEEWISIFEEARYRGDYELIYFD